VIVPASRNYITVEANVAAYLTETPPASAWTWWLDAVVLQRQL
jgi:hypothetical protein